MSEKPEAPPSQSAKPMPKIEKFLLFETDNPNLVGIGFDTAIGSFLVCANKRQVLEMSAKLRIVAGQMREPS
jgi:hypothetical protein